MCGRFAMDKEVDDMIVEFIGKTGRPPEEWRPGWKPAYSFAPTDTIALVRERKADNGTITREIAQATWDVSTATGYTAHGVIINTKAEKLASPFWSQAFSLHRCIVPMIGYYEWTGVKGDKQPHFLHGQGTLAAAGVYVNYEVDGKPRRAASIVTREARDASGELHARMPSFLTKDYWEAWLNPTPLTTDPQREELKNMLEANSDVLSPTIETYPVSKILTNPRTVPRFDPQLIEPV